jgi:hypothetical protein
MKCGVSLTAGLISLPSPIGRGAGGEGLETESLLKTQQSSKHVSSTANRSLFDYRREHESFHEPETQGYPTQEKVRGARAQALTPTLFQKGEGARMKCEAMACLNLVL